VLTFLETEFSHPAKKSDKYSDSQFFAVKAENSARNPRIFFSGRDSTGIRSRFRESHTFAMLYRHFPGLGEQYQGNCRDFHVPKWDCPTRILRYPFGNAGGGQIVGRRPRSSITRSPKTILER